MRKNILFNTTRQWNPGDQIIMQGILRLLRHLDFNPIIYNRHPNVWGKGRDNSFMPGKHTLENIDYYIHAGTPEWCDQKFKPLFDEILKRDIPHSFIGIGGSGTEALKTFSSLVKMLETSELLTARDQSAYETTKPFGGIKLPCPGFLCGDLPTQPRTKLNTVGLVFMACDTPPNAISPKLYLELVEEYKWLIKRYNVIIICHYIDEVIRARTHFPNTPVFYSYDAVDFAGFYNRCDLITSPRLHGVLLAAGLGIPGTIVAGHREDDRQRRLEGVKQLDIPSLDLLTCSFTKEDSEYFNIKKESKRLIDLRYKTEIEYLGLFTEKMKSLFVGKTICPKMARSIQALLNTRRKLNDTL